jgi:hypothetical protein
VQEAIHGVVIGGKRHNDAGQAYGAVENFLALASIVRAAEGASAAAQAVPPPHAISTTVARNRHHRIGRIGRIGT